MVRKTGDSLKKKYDFRWEILDIIIRGKSSIDLTSGFQAESIEEADRFVHSYGYDLDNPIEKAEVVGNFHEAMNFIRKNFLQPESPDGLKIEIPRKILELTDVRDLLLMSALHYPGQTNETQGIQLQNWACSLLKVMHTIAHIDKDLRSNYFSDIQTQIFDRFYKVIHRDDEGKLFLGDGIDDPHRVDLIAFETKPKKSRDSILLKLLHKPENVAEDIFDRVGIRFVSTTKLDALRVIKYLQDKMIVMPPNIKPSRSRNSLLDLDDFRTRYEDIFSQHDRGEIDDAHATQQLEHAAHPPAVNPDNPHSSEFYRSIHFTARQLIKLKNPLYSDLKELKTLARAKAINEEIAKVIERIDLKHIQKEVRFFYPFEVQIMDQKSAEENEKGRSAHSEYKRAQLQTALRRVMGPLADGTR